MDKIPLKPLERKLADSIRVSQLKEKKILLSVSGGLDSVALLEAMKRVAPNWGIQFLVAHVHHGESSESAINDYRNRAQAFVEDLSKGYEFHLLKGSGKNEEEWRNSRRTLLFQLKEEKGLDCIAMAHHMDDLLETRLIVLIRGVGELGLSAMQMYTDGIFRPFLETPQREIQEYLKDQGVGYVEDPSNKDPHHLRNWLRNSWLKDLENYRPGSLKSLNRSLENLASGVNLEWVNDCIDQNRILRNEFGSLEKSTKMALIAYYLRKNDVRGYGATHLNEIVKRLESNQKEFRFQILKRDWIVDASHICLGQMN